MYAIVEMAGQQFKSSLKRKDVKDTKRKMGIANR